MLFCVHKLPLDHKTEEKQEYVHGYFNQHLCASKKRIQEVDKKCAESHLHHRQKRILRQRGSHCAFALKYHLIIQGIIIKGRKDPCKYRCGGKIGNASTLPSLQEIAENGKQDDIAAYFDYDI